MKKIIIFICMIGILMIGCNNNKIDKRDLITSPELSVEETFENPFIQTAIQQQMELHEFVLNYLKQKELNEDKETLKEQIIEGVRLWISANFEEYLSDYDISINKICQLGGNLDENDVLGMVDSVIQSSGWKSYQKERYYELIDIVLQQIQSECTIEGLHEALRKFDEETYTILQDESDPILKVSASLYSMFYAFNNFYNEWSELLTPYVDGTFQKPNSQSVESILCDIGFGGYGIFIGVAFNPLGMPVVIGAQIIIVIAGALVCP